MKNNLDKMTWEEKVQMIELSNNADNKESRQQFLKYVTENIDKFDSQAYDMFITAYNLIPEEMKEDIEYHKIIFPYIDKELMNGTQGLITSLRLALYVTTCEKELDLKKTT